MTDDDSPDFDSGPYCVHWGDPSDCDDPCLRPGCGHACCKHPGFDGECSECNCRCLVWRRDGVLHGE